MTRVVVLTGAGISAESGVPTFRDAQRGLWARFDPEELATPQAWRRRPDVVPCRSMSIEQVCLIIALNLLAGTFLAWQARARKYVLGSLILLATILFGFAMLWRSFI